MNGRWTAAALVAVACALPHAVAAEMLDRRAAASLERLQARARVEGHLATPDGAAVRMIRGRLTAPGADTPAAATLRLLSEHRDLFGLEDLETLALTRVARVGSSHVVRFRQVVDGVPVVGGQVSALVDSRGQVRLVFQGLASTTVREPPLLSELDAAELAADSVVRPAAPPAARHAQPVYLPVEGGLRPAYAVHYGPVPALFANWYAIVDAVTGEVLSRWNRVMTDRVVMTWPESPATTALEAVTLDPETFLLEGQDCVAEGSLPPTTAEGDPTPDATVPRLCTSRFSVRNCWDFHETITVNIPTLGPTNLHVCSEYHMALPNDAPAGVEEPDDEVENDFFFSDHGGDLGYDYAEDAALGEDLFAEPSLMFHLERIHAYFSAFGPELFRGLRNGQLLVSANWRIPFDVRSIGSGSMAELLALLLSATNPNGPLYPFDNAMFVPGGNLFGLIERESDSLLFFQGRHRDFAYDSDVVYHEFTHAVVGTVVDGIGLGVTRRDEQGMHRLSAAMNEAYADFFACAKNGNPVQGEYALGGPGMPGGRDLSIRPRPTCPGRLENEEHHDSAPYSGALWEIREALDPAAAERALFVALTVLPPNADFREGAAATIAALEVEIGPSAAASAEGIFARYGYDGEAQCERVIDLSGDAVHRQLGLFSTQTEAFAVSPYAPSLLQFRYELPPAAGARQIWVRWQQSSALDPSSLLGGGTPTPALLARHGEEPISFSTRGEVSSNADLLVEGVVADDRVGGSRLEYHLDGEVLPEGVYHFMVVNMTNGAGALANLVVDHTDEPPEGASDGDGDIDADADADEEGEQDADLEPDGGDGDEGTACGCRAADPRGGSGALRRIVGLLFGA